MTAPALHFNPFAQLVSPAEVLDAIRQSEALESLRSEVFRPLDRPFLKCFDKLVDIDAEIDAMPDEIFEDEFEDDEIAIERHDPITLWG